MLYIKYLTIKLCMFSKHTHISKIILDRTLTLTFNQRRISTKNPSFLFAFQKIFFYLATLNILSFGRKNKLRFILFFSHLSVYLATLNILSFGRKK